MLQQEPKPRKHNQLQEHCDVTFNAVFETFRPDVADFKRVDKGLKIRLAIVRGNAHASHSKGIKTEAEKLPGGQYDDLTLGDAPFGSRGKDCPVVGCGASAGGGMN